MSHSVFTSESVTEGHPDKICDQVSDAVLDALLYQDPNSRVACETVVNTGLCLITGEVISKAKIDAGKSKIDLENTRRTVLENVENAWESLKSARAQIKSFKAQILAAEIALEGVQREASVGSRTVLDVLDAEQELLDARVSLVGAQRDEVVASFQLKEATGQLTAKNLELPVTLFDPTNYYNKVRDTIFDAESLNLINMDK